MKTILVVTACIDPVFDLEKSKLFIGYSAPNEVGLLEDYFYQLGYYVGKPYPIQVEDNFSDFTLKSPRQGAYYINEPSKN